MIEPLRVDCDRLLAALDKMSAIGRTTGNGVTRLALSSDEQAARRLAERWLEEAGLSVRVDTVGNVIGTLPGTRKGWPAVAAGSHLDSVIDGGQFDGVVGTLAAIEAARAIATAGIEHSYPIEVIVFMGEESARFGVGVLGSRAMVGTLPVAHLTELFDRDGVTLAQALRDAGLDPEQIGTARRRPGELKAFLELHIEQGSVLEARGVGIGIVEAIAAPTNLRVSIRGTAGHAGTVPMSERRDAIVAAAMMIAAVEQAALGDPEGIAVATVGALTVVPGVINVIPGEVVMDVDVRHRSAAAKARTVAAVIDGIEEVATRRGVNVQVEVLVEERPVETAPEIRDALMAACVERGIEYIVMHSGAYHDAMSVAAIAPVGMLFIPCRGGVSHQPGEWAEPEDICRGAQVLADAMLALAR